MPEQVILSNRYLLEQRLGSGGMAMVYRARDLMLERTVAIKILRKSFTDIPEFRERFRQEAKAAANLSHPNIVTIHDFGLDSNQLFIVMEFVPGTDIKTLLKQRGRFSIEEALDLITQACAGIGYAHRAGLIHCDIKPQNLLVTPDKRLKVLDFGIARLLASVSPDERSEVVWGSPQYFSPEQAAGAAPSPASDVYSLGVVLYEMLTGQLPFTATSPQELARLHRESLPPSPRLLNPSIPSQLEQILLKILSKEPSGRYRTADQMGHVLSAYRQNYIATPAIAPAPVISINVPAALAPKPEPTPAREPAPRLISATYGRAKPHRPARTSNSRSNAEFDWLTWLLALLALIFAGGLIPFWLWVFYILNPPV